MSSFERLPETPHELPIDRGIVDEIIVRARAGDSLDLLESLLLAIDWSQFAPQNAPVLSGDQLSELQNYYREKWADIGPLYLAELLSTEFMTEQRARGDIVFSDRLLDLGRTEPDLWQEIRQFFRRKEMVTGLLVAAHAASRDVAIESASPDEEEGNQE